MRLAIALGDVVLDFCTDRGEEGGQGGTGVGGEGDGAPAFLSSVASVPPTSGRPGLRHAHGASSHPALVVPSVEPRTCPIAVLTGPRLGSRSGVPARDAAGSSDAPGAQLLPPAGAR